MGAVVILSHLGQIISFSSMAFDLAMKFKAQLSQGSGDFTVDVKAFDENGLLSDDRNDKMIAEYWAGAPPTP